MSKHSLKERATGFVGGGASSPVGCAGGGARSGPHDDSQTFRTGRSDLVHTDPPQEEERGRPTSYPELRVRRAKRAHDGMAARRPSRGGRAVVQGETPSSPGRDETRPISTGGRDETCPVSTGGRGRAGGGAGRDPMCHATKRGRRARRSCSCALSRNHSAKARGFPRPAIETCPVSTGGGTRRVQSVREGGGGKPRTVRRRRRWETRAPRGLGLGEFPPVSDIRGDYGTVK